MNQDNANQAQMTDLDEQLLEEHQDWAALLSKAANSIPADSSVVPVVLHALKAERQGTADGSAWARYLSGAAQLQSRDFDAVQPALQAVRLERRRAGQWRQSFTRLIAGAAAVAAVVAAVAVFTPARSADPMEAYSAYQEAARGW